MKALAYKGVHIVPMRKGKKTVYNVKTSPSNMFNLNENTITSMEAAKQFVDLREVQYGSADAL